MHPPAPASAGPAAPSPPPRPPAAVEVRGLSRRFQQVQALAGVDLAVQPGEFFSLLGPSGCGKTTLLRILAGLECPEAGSVHLDGQEVTHLPAHRRPVNTVFQSYALFPHLTVYDNVAFGLRMRRCPRPELHRRVQEALDLVQISPLAPRQPAQLSGGQKQRVALARALINQPRVLLLDEPLGALDPQLRRHLQTELRALQRRLGLTFLHVTHDQDEALALSDRIAVMRLGRIEQIADPHTLYDQPATRFVAEFLGHCNTLEVSTLTSSDHQLRATTPLGPLLVATPPPSPPHLPLVALIRPERLRLLPGDAPRGPNHFPATLLDITYAGAETHCQVEAQGQRLNALLLNADYLQPRWNRGQPLLVELPPHAVRLVPA